MKKSLIRNFSIIAHIDHGKSTLADRIIEKCGGLSSRELKEQVLDSMALERERGITIKAQTASLMYHAEDGQVYTFNLIDTPGHVDFSYEVSRSLSACEGALLVVDAAQGVQAQTVENCYTALDLGLEIIPVINKIDLPSAEPERVKSEIEEVIGLDAKDALLVSAKTGLGVEALLERIIFDIPEPRGDSKAPLSALIIDSWFDNYRGVIMLVRLFDGTLKKGDSILLMGTKKIFTAESVGIFTPKAHEKEELFTGEVGFVITGIRDIQATRVGDTITHPEFAAKAALPGFKVVKPQVFAGLYPIDTNDFEALREALGKLQLNDASLTFEPETSLALGFGFRCGFLGLLHMDIVEERLEREYNLALITTAPTVVYQVKTKSGDIVDIDNPSQLPPPERIEAIAEPVIAATILVPREYLGDVLTLCNEKRGIPGNIEYLGKLVRVSVDLPLAEVVFDFFDRLKSVSRGYASMDYDFKEYRNEDLIKLDILVNGERVDALSTITHRLASYQRGRVLVEKLKTLIPRQMFDVAVQAAIGGKIIARESIKAMRKNVLAKCYGGDVSRKKKLLEKQKEGKKRMKKVGNVEIPQEAFLAVLQAEQS